ncbi:BING4CT (NUC141) domain-containing protein [Chloropicon primus]|nr:BING4CT (NUC141) domain-containing protein [Chloropicon primus]
MAASGRKAVSRKHREARGQDGTKVVLATTGEGPNKVVDRKLKGRMKREGALDREAAKNAAGVEFWLNTHDHGELAPENELEKTWRLKQEEVASLVEVGAASKRFDLKLEDHGPYACNYSRDGRWLLLGGKRGHLAMLDWQRHKVVCEVQVKEAVRDVCFLHNSVFFAAAQKKQVYVYDKRGIEVHCMKEHRDVEKLTFLPQHFLLASVGAQGILRYQDTSTGEIVAMHRTKLGPCKAMCRNPFNGIVLCGHAGGTITMWSPNMTVPLVKMLCHRGPVNSLAVDQSGRYLVTIGSDKQMKVWDVRTYKLLHAYFCSAPAKSVEISQRGLVGISWGSRVQVWKDALHVKAKAPYMNHQQDSGYIRQVSFCPYEDVLGIGHERGFSSILVPGAGEPNYDSFVANPYQTRKERREHEVHALLDKLQPDTIVLNPQAVGNLKLDPKEIVAQKKQEQRAAIQSRTTKQREKNEAKNKMKGKNKPTKRHRKKQMNVIRDQKEALQELVKRKDRDNRESKIGEDVPSSLKRFY